MKILCFLISIHLALSIVGGSAAHGCTSFHLISGKEAVFGKNLDWILEAGHVFVNKRGVPKSSLLVDQNVHGAPAKWISKYGSITFNQMGCDLPMGGMNETGLVVETMYLKKSRYPSRDERQVLHTFQWVQYQLDNAATITEVIESDHAVRIRPNDSGTGHHYLVADSSGDCAVIEFIDGRMIHYRGNQLPVRALTNSLYTKSLAYWEKDRSPFFDRYHSIKRFNHTASMLSRYEGHRSISPVDYAFDILTYISNPGFTVWSIVYDINNRRIFFRTHTEISIRWIELNAFDFSCSTPIKVLNIMKHIKGDATEKFKNYSHQYHRDLIMCVFEYVSFLNHYSDETLEKLSRYPDELYCQKTVNVKQHVAGSIVAGDE